MAARRSLIIVSNRGPITYDRDAAGNRVKRRGGGGLVSALRGLLEHHDVTWIASATTVWRPTGWRPPSGPSVTSLTSLWEERSGRREGWRPPPETGSRIERRKRATT